MIYQNQSHTLESAPRSYQLRYRCLECGELVEGTQHAAGQISCERCQAPLDEDDEVAQPDPAVRWDQAARRDQGNPTLFPRELG